MIYTKRLLTGALTFAPGFSRFAGRRTGGTTSARYCYAVWLRHVVKAHEAGIRMPPDSLAELGPGDSLGTGLAALLSGARSYYAFDVVPYARETANRAILEELIALYKARERVPGRDEFPEVRPDLDSYDFPGHVLSDDLLADSLAPDRLTSIRAVVAGGSDAEVEVRYVPDWHDAAAVTEGTLDMVFSQAVLEHVDDLERAYGVMHRWLRAGGLLSHTIDYRSHGAARGWNGHWALGDFSWKVVRGRRPFLLNREPHSTHLAHLQRLGFELVTEIRTTRRPDVERHRLAPRFRSMSDDDLTTSDAFIQAVKPA